MARFSNARRRRHTLVCACMASALLAIGAADAEGIGGDRFEPSAFDGGQLAARAHDGGAIASEAPPAAATPTPATVAPPGGSAPPLSVTKADSLWTKLATQAVSRGWLCPESDLPAGAPAVAVREPNKLTESVPRIHDFLAAFRLSSGPSHPRPALELVLFEEFVQGQFRWTTACYELWELQGDPETATPDTPLARLALGCRYWHRGAPGDFKFVGWGSPVRLGHSQDWEEIHWSRPPTLAMPVKTTLQVLQQLLEGNAVPANGMYIPERLGHRPPATRLSLKSAGGRIDPPAWSDQPEAVFPKEP